MPLVLCAGRHTPTLPQFPKNFQLFLLTNSLAHPLPAAAGLLPPSLPLLLHCCHHLITRMKPMHLACPLCVSAVWEMFYCKDVYDNLLDGQICVGVSDGSLRPEFDDTCPLPYRRLAERCWSQNPE